MVASCLQDREKGRLTEDPSRAHESTVRSYPTACTLCMLPRLIWHVHRGYQRQTTLAQQTRLTELCRIQESRGIWHMAQVGALLHHQNLEARIWGVQAFTAYVHTQVHSHGDLTG